MKAVSNSNFNQVSNLALKLPKADKLRLIKTLKETIKEENSNTEVLDNLRQSLIELKNGSLETRPFDEFMAELKAEGYL